MIPELNQNPQLITNQLNCSHDNKNQTCASGTAFDASPLEPIQVERKDTQNHASLNVMGAAFAGARLASSNKIENSQEPSEKAHQNEIKTLETNPVPSCRSLPNKGSPPTTTISHQWNTQKREVICNPPTSRRNTTKMKSEINWESTVRATV